MGSSEGRPALVPSCGFRHCHACGCALGRCAPQRLGSALGGSERVASFPALHAWRLPTEAAWVRSWLSAPCSTDDAASLLDTVRANRTSGRLASRTSGAFRPGPFSLKRERSARGRRGLGARGLGVGGSLTNLPHLTHPPRQFFHIRSVLAASRGGKTLQPHREDHARRAKNAESQYIILAALDA